RQVVFQDGEHIAGVEDQGPVESRSDQVESEQVQELVEDAKNGDHRAFEALVRQTYADTYTLAYRLVGNEEDARDVVQETYLRAHKGLKKFRGDAQLSTWLHRITANCASSYLGRKIRHRHETLSDTDDIIDEHPGVDPAQRADIGVLRTQLSDALMQLPPKLRAVVVLRDIYDLPHEAIAEQLDITESAAKVRLHRARKRLRERLYPLREEEAHAV
ncbi:MAG: RNA polymerase sigma factor, partial [Actinomycetota bacterium]